MYLRITYLPSFIVYLLMIVVLLGSCNTGNPNEPETIKSCYESKQEEDDSMEIELASSSNIVEDANLFEDSLSWNTNLLGADNTSCYIRSNQVHEEGVSTIPSIGIWEDLYRENGLDRRNEILGKKRKMSSILADSKDYSELRKGFRQQEQFTRALCEELGFACKLGRARGKERSFFDSLAQLLNKHTGSKYTYKDLRMKCDAFYTQNKQLVEDWYNVDKGRFNVEGRILCEKLNMNGICVIDISEVEGNNSKLDINYEVLDTTGRKAIDAKKAGYLIRIKRIPTLVIAQQESHYVPLWYEVKKEELKDEEGGGIEESVTFDNLDWTLWLEILSYVRFPEIIYCRGVNNLLYQLITRYHVVAPLGVINKPGFTNSRSSWGISTVIDFRKPILSELTVENIPSFSFYQLMKKVRNLPVAFWPYLTNTQVEEMEFFMEQKEEVSNEEIPFLCQQLESNLNLKKLTLSSIRLDLEATQALSRILPSLPNLESLILCANHLGNNEIKTLTPALKQLGNLKKLQLNELCVDKIDFEGIRALASILRHLHKLEALTLAYSELGNTKMEALFQGLAQIFSLKKLNFNSNQIGSTISDIFVTNDQLFSRLEVLNLSNNEIGDEKAKILFEYLRDASNLKMLKLASNQIGLGGMEELARILPSLTNLQVLNLAFNELDDVGGNLLFGSLAMSTSLKRLNLHDNQLEGNKCLTTNLCHVSKLEALNLSCNQLTNAGSIMLFRSLARATDLRKLDLSGNELGLKKLSI